MSYATIPAGSGGGGAPTDSPYITIAADSSLTGERSLAGETNVVSITDNGVNSTVVIGLASTGIATGKIANNAVDDTKLRDGTALTVIGRSANSTGDPADIAAVAASGAVLREAGSVLGFGTIATAGVTNNAIDDTKLRDGAALTVIGRSANSTGDPGDIAASAASGAVLRESGSVLGFGTIATAGITDAAVTSAKLRNSAATSVMGRSAASTGVPADIAATTDGDVLRMSGTTLSWGTLVTASITDAAITSAKLRNSGALSVIGRSANSSGVPGDIAASAASDAVFRESGSTVGFGTIVAGGIASDAVTTVKILDANVTMAKLANLAGMSIVGRSTNSSGVPAAITAVTSGHVLTCVGGTSVAFAAPAAAATDITGMTALADVSENNDYFAMYDASAAANRKVLLKDIRNPYRNVVIIDEDFAVNQGPSIYYGPNSFLYFVATGTGSQGAGGAAEASHPGKLQLVTGNVASDWAALWSGNNDSCIYLGGGVWRYCAIILTPSALSDGTTTYLLRVGFSDANQTCTDGIQFSYTHGTNSGKWLLTTTNNGVATTGDCGISVVASTWYRLEFVVNAAATSVQAYINGASAGSAITTNIPNGAGRETGVHFSISKTVGTALRILTIDYVYVACELTTAR